MGLRTALKIGGGRWIIRGMINSGRNVAEAEHPTLGPSTPENEAAGRLA